MDWPDEVPYFTEDDVHVGGKEYEIIEDGITKRCVKGWLQHLFVDWSEYGLPDMKIYNKAEKIVRRIGQIPKNESLENWNDRQTKKKIVSVLNKTMKELGYHT